MRLRCWPEFPLYSVSSVPRVAFARARDERRQVVREASSTGTEPAGPGPFPHGSTRCSTRAPLKEPSGEIRAAALPVDDRRAQLSLPLHVTVAQFNLRTFVPFPPCSVSAKIPRRKVEVRPPESQTLLLAQPCLWS